MLTIYFCTIINKKYIVMNQKKITISLCMAFLFVISCHSQGNDFLSKAKVVAKKKGELIVCDNSMFKETMVLPLSFFTEELQMVKLDNADEALVVNNMVLISNNYILVKGRDQVPYKLFDKKTGKYICNIGSVGQGPGEYQMIYDQQLDEENNRIYLLPWFGEKILVYDLKGKVLDPIPLCSNAPKGNFKVDTKAGTLFVSALPFEGLNAVVWQQTVKGELLKSVTPGHLTVPRDFSNEIGAYKLGSMYGFNVFTFVPRPDSVYHYDVNQNKLIPVFTMEFNSGERSIHSYIETKKYFMGDFSEIKKIDDYSSTTQNQRYYIVDKQTLKGTFFALENDFLGGMEIGWPIYSLSGEYYAYNVEPGDLIEALEKVLSENKKMTPEMKSKLTKLKDSVSDSENNYIFYAKFK